MSEVGEHSHRTFRHDAMAGRSRATVCVARHPLAPARDVYPIIYDDRKRGNWGWGLGVVVVGGGIAQWLERRTRDWKVAGSNPCWNGGRIFFSRVDFLCWLLFRYPFHPRVTTVARKKSRSFCQKCRWAGGRGGGRARPVFVCMFVRAELPTWCQRLVLVSRVFKFHSVVFLQVSLFVVVFVVCLFRHLLIRFCLFVCYCF